MLQLNKNGLLEKSILWEKKKPLTLKDLSSHWQYNNLWTTHPMLKSM